MRLLQHKASHERSSTHEFILTEFKPSDIPRDYATLSHRWGPPSDEVTYKDLENNIAWTKKGFQKLKFCAERVARDGIPYFWIDTCCIDKTSSAELSEAINSMYKWYQHATKCYVYLSDVSVVADCGWPLAFESSEWFKRGWTLPELVAPAIVEFFSTEGEFLGDKRSRQGHIHEITGVPVEALQGQVTKFDVEQRLSWAAKRRTSLEEDAVYCLLGIVDVHMPLIYGEGRQKALARLRREIQMSHNPSPWGEIGQSGLEAQSSITHNTNEVTEAVSGLSSRQTPAREVMEYQSFVRSLSYPEMDYRYYNVDDVQDDTCTWLLNHNHYKNWHSHAETNNLLMIRGKPGSGKSTAMKRAYILAKEEARANEATLAFFFNSRGAPMECKLEGFFRSTLHQLLKKHNPIGDKILIEWREKAASIKSGWTWAVQELQDMFQRCILQSSAKVTLFVDALDECESTSAARDLLDLLTDLGHGYGSHRSRLRVCASSRHYPNVGVAEPLQITVERTNQTDIASFVRKKLRRLVTDSDDLSSNIASRAEGIFLWALLVLTKIRAAVEDGEPQKTLYTIIELVPRRLERLFQELIDSTPVIEREQRNHLVLWVLFAKRPLSLSEINHALAFRVEYATYMHYTKSDDFVRTEQMKRLLAKRSRGLVEAVDVQERHDETAEPIQAFRVQFIHESVRQFILSKHKTLLLDSDMKGSISGVAHNILARSCLNYIKAIFTELGNTNDTVGQSKWTSFESEQHCAGYTEYATKYGFEHAEAAEANGFPQSYLFESIKDPTSGLASWWISFTLFMNPYQSHLPRIRSRLEYDAHHDFWSNYITSELAGACAYNLHSWVQFLLEDNRKPGKAALSQALCSTAISGDERSLTLLIQAGADVNHNEAVLGSPLYLSLVYDRLDILTVLLKHKASICVGPQKRSALVLATLYSSVEAVQLLLAHGASFADYEGQQPTSSMEMHALEAATKRDSTQAFSRRNSSDETQRDLEIFQILLDAAERQNVHVEHYQTAFLWAQVACKENYVESLRSAIIRLFPSYEAIAIIINTMNGPHLRLELWADTPFATLKQIIYSLTGLPPHTFMLVDSRRVFKDHQTLSDANVHFEATVHVVKRARWQGLHGG